MNARRVCRSNEGSRQHLCRINQGNRTHTRFRNGQGEFRASQNDRFCAPSGELRCRLKDAVPGLVRDRRRPGLDARVRVVDGFCQSMRVGRRNHLIACILKESVIQA